MLRVKFEQASICTPCLLVLRHLEALTQTTQAFEGKKGKSYGIVFLFLFSFLQVFNRQDSPIVTALRECIDGIQTSWKTSGYPLIVIGTTCAGGSLPVNIISCFKQEILFEVSYLQLRHLD